MPKIIENKKDIIKRKKALFKKMPRNYRDVIEHFYPNKYTKNQLQNFRNNKTMNINILEDLEIIFKK